MSIDRRLFFQSATAALGGAVLTSDAVGQSRFTATGTYSMTTPPHGPYKPPYYKVGDQAQRYYEFLKDLFDPNKSLRDDIWKMKDSELRDLANDRLGLDLSDTKIRIMIVDIGKGRAKFSDGKDCSVTGCAVTDPNAAWYTLVLPPLPMGYLRTDGTPQKGYLEEMTWESAWHHAIVYGYGM
jgi:hypothetical protein